MRGGRSAVHGRTRICVKERVPPPASRGKHHVILRIKRHTFIPLNLIITVKVQIKQLLEKVATKTNNNRESCLKYIENICKYLAGLDQ